MANKFSTPTISLRNAVAGNPAMRLKSAVTLDIMEGEQIALTGDNGSGKTLLAGLLTGQYPVLAGGSAEFSHRRDSIRSIAFRDSYGSAKGFFLSQGSDPTVDEITKK